MSNLLDIRISSLGFPSGVLLRAPCLLAVVVLFADKAPAADWPQYRADAQQIWCACHNGTFDLRGRNLSGPPPKPLEEFAVNIVNDEIFVSKITQES